MGRKPSSLFRLRNTLSRSVSIVSVRQSFSSSQESSLVRRQWTPGCVALVPGTGTFRQWIAVTVLRNRANQIAILSAGAAAHNANRPCAGGYSPQLPTDPREVVRQRAATARTARAPRTDLTESRPLRRIRRRISRCVSNPVAQQSDADQSPRLAFTFGLRCSPQGGGKAMAWLPVGRQPPCHPSPEALRPASRMCERRLPCLQVDTSRRSRSIFRKSRRRSCSGVPSS